MKKIVLICGLMLGLAANAQTTKPTPQQQIEQQRQKQVQSQEPTANPVVVNTARTEPVAPVENNTMDTRNIGKDSLVNSTTQGRNIPEQQTPDNLGGAGNSGTAPNTIGAPLKKNKTKAINSNRRAAPAMQTDPPANQNMSNGTNATRRGTNTK